MGREARGGRAGVCSGSLAPGAVAVVRLDIGSAARPAGAGPQRLDRTSADRPGPAEERRRAWGCARQAALAVASMSTETITLAKPAPGTGPATSRPALRRW